MIRLILPLLRSSFFRKHLGLFHVLFFNNLLPKKEKNFKREGLHIFLKTQDLIDARIAYTNSYEPELRSKFKELIHNRNIVLDVGANIGYHTLLFSKLCGAEGMVYSFEPVKKNYDRLLVNLELNKIKNVVPCNYALGNVNSTLFIDTASSGHNPGSISLLNESKLGEKIDCKNADDAIHALNIDHIDFIKIDVEGYEWYVLEGLKKTISTYRPKIIFEWDLNYQLKSEFNSLIFENYFRDLNYYLVNIEDPTQSEVKNLSDIISANILAQPNENE